MVLYVCFIEKTFHFATTRCMVKIYQNCVILCRQQVFYNMEIMIDGLIHALRVHFEILG